ncbi:MAG: aminopeptidase P family protein [Candidatus Doudnabacteria bacterium]|nr:aminopeptidase P family protein [Candidatus Doudnabacteria bacterium]
MTKLIYNNSKDSTFRYAVGGFEVADPTFVLDMDGKRLVFLDHREFGMFESQNTQPNIEAVLANPIWEEAVSMSADERVEVRCGFVILQKYNLFDERLQVPANFPLFMADGLRRLGVKLEAVDSLYPERLQKTEQEVGHIREALIGAQAAFRRIEEVLQESSIVGDEIHWRSEVLTSEVLKIEAERALLDVGMSNDEEMVVSCGSHAAIPHHRGKGALRPHATIVCDIFPRHKKSGYYADMTRTYVKGEPSEQVRKMYQAVADAQRKGFEIIRTGMSSLDVHDQVEQVFLDAGFHVGDAGFIHGTGHGLGLDIHELPFMNRNHNSVMEVGHVVTVEPGLYYPEHGGVRIEDVVVVTPDGVENLTKYPIDNWIIS